MRRRFVSACIVITCMASCTEVRVEDDGGGGAGGDQQTSTATGASGGGGASDGVGGGGAGDGGGGDGGGEGGAAPVVLPSCGGFSDTFDGPRLMPAWSPLPPDLVSITGGQVQLLGEQSYLKLQVPPADCAFGFTVGAVLVGRLSLQVLGPDGSIIQISHDGNDVDAFAFDAETMEGEQVPWNGAPAEGLALGFDDAGVTTFVLVDSTWSVVATFDAPVWLAETEPEVRFVDVDGGGAAYVDDYGIISVPAVEQDPR